MADRITDRDVRAALRSVTRLLKEQEQSGVRAVTLHRGNGTHKVHNMLVVEHYDGSKTQVWPNGIAGCTGREAYRALKVMEATLAIAHWTDGE